MYANRVTEVEQATFTPLVFPTTEGMAEECTRYQSILAEHAWSLRTVASFLKEESTSPSFGFFLRQQSISLACEYSVMVFHTN